MSGQRILCLRLQASPARYLLSALIFSEFEHFDLLYDIFDFAYLYAAITIRFADYFE